MFRGHTDRHQTDGHHDLQTESAQWADSVKLTKPFNKRNDLTTFGILEFKSNEGFNPEMCDTTPDMYKKPLFTKNNSVFTPCSRSPLPTRYFHCH